MQSRRRNDCETTLCAEIFGVVQAEVGDKHVARSYAYQNRKRIARKVRMELRKKTDALVRVKLVAFRVLEFRIPGSRRKNDCFDSQFSFVVSRRPVKGFAFWQPDWNQVKLLGRNGRNTQQMWGIVQFYSVPLIFSDECQSRVLPPSEDAVCDSIQMSPPPRATQLH